MASQAGQQGQQQASPERQLLDLPLGCLELLLGQLRDAGALLAPFRTCHALRRLALSAAQHVQLHVYNPIDSMEALLSVLELPKDSRCFPALTLRGPHSAQLAGRIPVLLAGRVQELTLEVGLPWHMLASVLQPPVRTHATALCLCCRTKTSARPTQPAWQQAVQAFTS